jgi:3',5'-cyclic AMP phosphodiesterase CpdA
MIGWRHLAATMPTIDLLHLGDIHYPDYWETVDVDHKDEAAPKAIVGGVMRRTLEEVVNEALKVRDGCGKAIVIVSGDLTSRALMDPYETCVQWLAASFGLPVGSDRFHVVPGNHDVVRTLANAPDLMDKFGPAVAAWASAAPGVLAFDAPRRTVIADGPANLAVISMNSCAGSGENRYLPDSVREQLADIIAAFDARAVAAGDPLGQVYEQLDTPAFIENHVKALLGAIEAEPQTLPVVVAHHNLLPQATERFEIYTELVNGGSVRSRLAGRGRPVLYLHGHTHTSPIEIVTQRAPAEGTLISLGAPLLVDGFNHIRIEFEPVKGEALGLTLTEHRIHPGGGFSKHDHRIPLSAALGPPTPTARALDKALGDQVEYFADISDGLAAEGHDATSVALAARELEWRGTVVIDNRTDDTHYWQIRRVLK